MVDASAVADALLARGVRGDWARAEIGGAGSLSSPHLLDVEVVSVISKRVLRNELPRARAGVAVAHLAALRVQRYSTTPLLRRIWELTVSLSAYDAAYIALAEALNAPLVTTDARLARSPQLPVLVRTP